MNDSGGVFTFGVAMLIFGLLIGCMIGNSIMPSAFNCIEYNYKAQQCDVYKRGGDHE